MSGDATKVVGISDLLKGVAKMAPDAVGMIKTAPGLIRRPPDAKRTIGSIFAKLGVTSETGNRRVLAVLKYLGYSDHSL